jgi:Flp pilus assembly pilin Flp
MTQINGWSGRPPVIMLYTGPILKKYREMTMTKRMLALWNDDQGQDLIEYTLLMAFVALASAAIFIGAGGSISGIWTTSNSQLTAANSSAS